MPVDDGHQLHARHRRQDARVMPAQVADADHCYPKRHRYLQAFLNHEGTKRLKIAMMLTIADRIHPRASLRDARRIVPAHEDLRAFFVFLVASWFGSDGIHCGSGRPTIAIFASFADARTASPSRISVLPASTESTAAPATRIACTVANPTTGTSKRMSCFGFATLTMQTPGPARCPALAITSSVPSIASTATTA